MVALVPEGAPGEPCPIYEVLALDDEGAHLGGQILLELDEVVVLEITFPDGARARVRAQVVAVEAKEEPAGVRVVFIEPDEAARQVIDAHRTPPS